MQGTYLSYSPITMEDVARHYPPAECIRAEAKQAYEGTVIALGQASWEAPPAEAQDYRNHFIEEMSRETAPGNLWITPMRPRMVYPLSPYWSLACCFATEKAEGRRFDWFVWADDDAVYSMSDVNTLLEAAKKHDVKFVSALPYDRMPPYQPSVCEGVAGDTRKWVKAPPGGTCPVRMVGLLLAVFHRSVFEMVPEPWFGVLGPMEGFSGMMPDWWWCLQMERAGLKPYVCCDTDVTHLGLRTHVNRKLSEKTLESDGVPPCARLGKLTPEVSGATGAMVVSAPTHFDGRVEHAPDKVDFSDATVSILTCDRDAELLDLCLRGVRKFWPSINVAVLKDTDPAHETPLPEDVREVVRRVRFLRKVFDLPFVGKTDTIYCMDSDCFLFDEPREWTGYRGLYVMPGTAGQDWLNKGADVWDVACKEVGIEAPPIDRGVIFCGGCWSASRKLMFEDTRDLAIAYVRECVKRGYDNSAMTGYAVICEQILLNGLWHLAHKKNPLPNYRFPLDEPNPQMAVYHFHMDKTSPVARARMGTYRKLLTDAGF